ncbi:MAG: hypothetical protein DIZ80_15025 [endosymbiont of Galathealinum brachiosum]|uniref:Uncharacterized protein n=1 Tax=endosymbiont of Galathealinum brachiosum TaxID=2200906 RepID=A0A370D931_9GAMM|nr:MAG: hypothetical protein DIZ80_15025 [endosymbiont of Galathealinum brachiosum]
MKHHQHLVINTTKKTNCIDEMDALLDQIADFKKLIQSPHKASDPGFLQEYRLFKQHVEWVSEDLATSSFITRSNLRS